MSNKQQFFDSIANHIWFCSQISPKIIFQIKTQFFLFMTLIIFWTVFNRSSQRFYFIFIFSIRSASFNCFPMIYLVFPWLNLLCWFGVSFCLPIYFNFFFFRLRVLFRLRFFCKRFFNASKWIYECDSISLKNMYIDTHIYTWNTIDF